ncbi:hypothetical protein BTVI_30658 [Pitangus sulphuratus]|nr:hypothetical protein BTVI_30658 [Pitangus sulphuratus]
MWKMKEGTFSVENGSPEKLSHQYFYSALQSGSTSSQLELFVFSICGLCPAHKILTAFFSSSGGLVCLLLKGWDGIGNADSSIDPYPDDGMVNPRNGPRINANDGNVNTGSSIDPYDGMSNPDSSVDHYPDDGIVNLHDGPSIDAHDGMVNPGSNVDQ